MNQVILIERKGLIALYAGCPALEVTGPDPKYQAEALTSAIAFSPEIKYIENQLIMELRVLHRSLHFWAFGGRLHQCEAFSIVKGVSAN